MASPQVENGFTRIANELLEALMSADLNGSEYRLMLAIIRESYGRQRKTTVLSYADFERLTKVHRNSVPRDLARLVDQGYVTRTPNGVNKPATWSVQKDYTKWGYSEPALSELAISEPALSEPVALSESAIRPLSESAITPHTPLIGRKKLKEIHTSADAPETLLDHPAVTAYRDTLKLTPNFQQRQTIASTVTDLDRWRTKLDRWQTNGYSPKNLTGLLDSYNKPDPATNGYHRANGRAGPALPPAPTETLEEMRAFAAAAVARGDYPAPEDIDG